MAKSNKVVKVNSTQKSVQSAADLNASENHAFGTKKKEDRMPTDKPTIMKSSNDSFRVKATAQKED